PEPHVREESVRDVVREPRLDPVEQARERRDDEEGREPSAHRSAPLDGQHGEGAHRSDPDQRGHAGHSEEERRHQASAVTAAEAKNAPTPGGPPQDPPRREGGPGGPRQRPPPFGPGRRGRGRPPPGPPFGVAPPPPLARHEPPVRAPALEELRVPSAL